MTEYERLHCLHHGDAVPEWSFAFGGMHAPKSSKANSWV